MKTAKILPPAILTGAVLAWIWVVGRLVVDRHNSFATFDFDLGIHDQSLWLLSKGQWFNTVCGLPVFGHHAMFMYWLLVPLVWLGGGPNLWNLIQVVALALGAVPVYLIAKQRLRSDVLACMLGISWLLLPTVSFLAWETWHPETLAVPFLMMGYHYATTRPTGFGTDVRRRNIIAFAWLLAAMLWKEDISLAVMGIGILLIATKRWKFGGALLGFAALYFLVFGVWMVPTLAGETSAYGMLYGELGQTPFDVVKTSLSEPSLFFDRLSNNNFIGYMGQLSSPLGFIPFLAPLTILMGVPQIFINILTTADFTWAMMYHYQAVPVAAMMLGAIEGAAFIARRSKLLGALAVTVTLVASCVAANAWSLLPFGDAYRKGYWPHGEQVVDGWKAALDRVGPTDPVSAHYAFVPHASQRKIIYTFPNPWVRTNFLGDPSLLESPSKIKWLVIPENTMGGAAAEVLQKLISTGEYGDPQTVAGITTYRRLKP
jgi:uncharacterized membrane protein